MSLCLTHAVVSRSTAGRVRAQLEAVALAVLVVAAATLLAFVLSHTGVLHGLSAMSERTIGARIRFTELTTYVENLRGALMALGVKLAGIAIVGVGAVMMIGSPQATQRFGAVLGGITLILFSPEIIA